MQKVKSFIFVFILFLFFSNEVFSQSPKPNMADWNGYAQLRFTTNFDNINSFALKRFKLWLNSGPGFGEHWGFHVQATLSSYHQEVFFLQDVKAFYKTGHFTLSFGQFTPHYSLQRHQSDYIVPLAGRSVVIKALIPNGTLGVRDVGIEGNFTNASKTVKAWLGVFNGTGILEYRFNNSGYMVTQRTAVYLFKKNLQTGYSVMYRKADQLQLHGILPDSVLFSGNDLRFNLFALYRFHNFEIQGEYLWASLNNSIANGYYVLATLNIGKNQISASWNQYNDLIESTANNPVIHAGYSYLMNGNKLKIMLDNGAQIANGKLTNYFAIVQFQIFLKQ